MAVSSSTNVETPTPSPADVAKAALRRLAKERAEPTPENYARAYALEHGGAAAPAAAIEPKPDAKPESGEAWAGLFERLVRGLERGGRQWTSARKKESLQRVLSGSRADAGRLQQRMDQLLGSWDSDDAPVAAAPEDGARGGAAVAVDGTPSVGGTGVPAASTATEANSAPSALDIAASDLAGTVRHALVPETASTLPNSALAQALVHAVDRLVQPRDADRQTAADVQTLCEQARLSLSHRHRAFDDLIGLCRSLTASLCELAEDDSWAQGQCAAMQTRLDEGLTPRGVRSVSDLLDDTRARQNRLRTERSAARDALKGLFNRMLSELGELGNHTGRFQESVGRYAEVIGAADTLESLTDVVREMVEESRTVQSLVGATRQRLQDEHARATGLAERVLTLESELRRLSDEVVTDQLTQVANRRGLALAFSAAAARVDRQEGNLCVGLLDIDNFKRLNDELGHNVGDEALKALAAVVGKALRPNDVVARYGGEEFVVLLPDTQVDEGRSILTRLQRSLSVGLFMHESKQVFVTFSAGITSYGAGEPLEQALDRADRALYEAKKTGKNRTCVA